MAPSSHAPRDTRKKKRASNYFEHWPPYVFYFPVIVCYLLLSYRHKSFTLLSIANPNFPDSKCAILDLIPAALAKWVGRYQQFRPDDYPSCRAGAARRLLNDSGMTFPLVVKPDLGLKGIGVDLLKDSRDLENYFTRYGDFGNFQFQEFIDWPGEAGVFYLRMPGAAKGRIISLAFKSPASVTGDGRSALIKLIKAKKIPRKKKQLFLNHNRHQLERIIEKGQTIPLMFTRNHDQGGVYRDGRAHITPELSNRFDDIARAMPNFYYGRFDVRFEALETFTKGERFKIIEINGSLSEAGDLFDTNARLGSVYLSYFRRLNRLFAICTANRKRGHQPVSLKKAIAKHRTVLKFINKGLNENIPVSGTKF